MTPLELSTAPPWAFVAGRWDTPPPAAASGPIDVRVVTWNVWFGRHMFGERRDALFAELFRRRPDVIALQEVTQDLLDPLLEEPWVRASYQVSEPVVRLGYDVVVLSRLPVRRIASVALPSEMGRRLVVAELACGLSVATVHLESTRDCIAARERQLGIIQPYLAAASPDAVLVGDMNFSPEDSIETAALDPGFVDVWPALRPAEPGYTIDTDVNTMRLDAGGEPAHKRIDRVLARSRIWRARTIELVGTSSIAPDDTFISDHFGLEVGFAC